MYFIVLKSKPEKRPPSVLGRPLYVIDHEKVFGALGQFEFQSELPLYSYKNWGPARIRGRSCRSINCKVAGSYSRSTRGGCKFHLKAKPARDPGFVDYWMVQGCDDRQPATEHVQTDPVCCQRR